MKKYILITGIVLVLICKPGSVLCQNVRDFVFKVRTTLQESPPSISFTWDSVSGDSVITICRKDKAATEWGDPIALLKPDATSFTDSNVEIGIEYEYRFLKKTSIDYEYWEGQNFTNYEEVYSQFQILCCKKKPVITYLSAGIKISETEYRGKVILLVDSNFVDSLRNELILFEKDLMGDGWRVLRKDISRSSSVKYVKSIIRDFYYSDTAEVKALILFGHIAVPYSGCTAFDGHETELGAWQADMYYGSMDEAVWTDEKVDIDTVMPFRRNESNNIPGDGKFDITYLPPDETIRLQIGRIDLSKMPEFEYSEAELLKKYIYKNHAYRYRINNPKLQALVQESFGWSNGWAEGIMPFRNYTALLNSENVKEGIYFTQGRRDSYLFSYANGGGDAEFLGNYISGVGYTTDFTKYNTKTVFTTFLSSVTGNWDYPNNFLRAALASNGWALTTFWSGFVYFTFHHMGMGETIGYGFRLSQNNPGTYDYNSDDRGIFMNLLGDPTLRMQIVCPVNSLQSAVTANNKVMLAWKPADDNILGYHIYRLDTVSNEYNRITTDPVTETWYTDTSMVPGNNYYMVKSYQLTHSASGSYYNLSQGVFDTLKYSAKTPVPVTGIELYLDPKNTLPLMIYNSFSVKANILPENATNKLLKWRVLNGSAQGRFFVNGDILAVRGGTLTVIAEALDGSGITDSLEIFIDSVPEAAGILSGDTMPCRDDQKKRYTVPEIRGASEYVWIFPGGGRDTTNFYEREWKIGSSAQSGTLKVQGHNPYADGPASNLEIFIQEIPDTPFVTVEGNILHSDAPEGNQWYRYYSPIEGATEQEYTVKDTGRYYSKVTLNNCTSNKSNDIIYPSGIKQNETIPLIKIYPNPATHHIIIEYNESFDRPITVELMDITGKVVYSDNSNQESSRHIIDLSDITEGIYFIRIRNDEISFTEKIIKAK